MVGTLAAQFVLASANGKDLADVFKDIDAASKLVEAAAEARTKAMERETTRINTLTTAYINFSAAALQGERARLMPEQGELQRSGRTKVAGLDTLLGGMLSGDFSRTGYLMSGQGGAPTGAETAALAQLRSLGDTASITYERVAEVVGALDAAAKSSGPFATDMVSIRDRVREQAGALVELGQRARENTSSLQLVDKIINGRAVGVEGDNQFGPEVPAGLTRSLVELERGVDRRAAILQEHGERITTINSLLTIQCWRAWREFKREQRDVGKVEDRREKGRQERLTSGFAALDASRDRQIANLTSRLEEQQQEMDAAGRRHRGELERLDRRLAAKSEVVIRTEADRDRGWDLARECHDDLRTMRHSANDLIMAAYSAGQRGEQMPAGIPPIPLLHSRVGKKPD
jgi:hypothetical protein